MYLRKFVNGIFYFYFFFFFKYTLGFFFLGKLQTTGFYRQIAQAAMSTMYLIDFYNLVVIIIHVLPMFPQFFLFFLSSLFCQLSNVNPLLFNLLKWYQLKNATKRVSYEPIHRSIDKEDIVILQNCFFIFSVKTKLYKNYYKK